ANSALDPARAFTDDESVVLDCFVALLLAIDEKYESIPLIAFPISFRQRLAPRHERPLPDLWLYGCP
ncbi:MAG TPA: hypothetical protein VK635_22495, partial [Bradyrhizobium sp.]|nr:hypothetical protein [Bradyrhizobium sp.]